MNQTMMLSLPNMGTDWFMGIYVKYAACCKYSREFFDPLCNPKHQTELDRAFGCEEQINMGNIAIRWDDLPTQEVYEATWYKESYNLTKELWSQFKVGFFVQHFDCFVFLRTLDMSLPASRRNSRGFGEAMFASLVLNRKKLDADMVRLTDIAIEYAENYNQRMVAGYYILSYKLLMEAEKYDLPVLKYELLLNTSLEEVMKALSVVPKVMNLAGMAKEIMLTRKNHQKKFDTLGAELITEKLVEATDEKYSRKIVPFMFK